MDEKTTEKSEALLRIEEEYDENGSNDPNEVEASKGTKDSDTIELNNDGIDEWIISDSTYADPEVSNLETKEAADEDDTKKRKRGRRGGKRRGIGQQKETHSGGFKSGKQTLLKWRSNQRNRSPRNQGAKNMPLSKLPDGILLVEDGSYIGYHCTLCNCSLNSLPSIKAHVAGFRHRMNIKTRNLEQKRKREGNTAKSESGNSARDVAPLSSLPDGILLIERGSYTGYHCTFCNCALNHFTSIKDHVAGFRHQLIIEAKSRLEEQKKSKANAAKSESENNAEKPRNEDDKIEAEGKNEENAGLPSEDSTSKAPVPTRSPLEDALATTSEPVVGLHYITQKQKQDEEPSFECRLCSVISEVDDMKAHVLGTRHRLMYMKATDPQKIAELMAKNLPKVERNREIREYIASVMDRHGKGTVAIQTSEESSSKAVKTTEASSSKAVKSSEPLSSRVVKTSEPSSAKAVATPNVSSSKAPRRRDRRENFDKTRKNIAARSTARQRINEEYSSRKKRRRDSYVSKENFSSRDSYRYSNSYPQFDQPSYYGNDSQLYAVDKERLFQPSSSCQDREGMADDPSKLPDIDVTNEEEAGIVMNVISSLTERFLKYKLKNVAGPGRDVLEKSLKGENLLHALSLLTDENNKEIIDRPPSLSKRDEVAHLHSAYKETTDIVGSERSMMERTYQDSDISLRKSISQTQHDLNDSRDAIFSKDRTRYTQRDWAEPMEVISKDVMDHSQYDWNKTREGKTRESMIQPRHDWDKSRDVRSSYFMNQSQDDWDQTRDKKLMNQLPSSYDQTKDVGFDRGIANRQQKWDWSDSRDSEYRKSTMSESKYNWVHGGNSASVRNISQPNLEMNVEKSKKLPDRLIYDWSLTRSSALETSRDSNSSNQFSRNWNESRPSLNIGNTNSDSFSKASYFSDKSENIPSLRSASLNQQEQKWSSYGQSQTQQAWNRSDQRVARGMNDRSFGQSAMGRDDSILGRSSSDSLMSQTNMSSLSQRRNISHAVTADALFDRYEKKAQADKIRNSLTTMGSGNHSYFTPSLTTRSHYLGSSTPSSYSKSTPSSYSKSSSLGQLQSGSSFVYWK